MADPLTVLLFVATGEGSEATTRAMARATREALGPGASVEVRETANELSDDEALIAERLAHADAVVDLTWSDPGHRNATLRVHVARTGRWIGRSLGFMASDAGTERGRTIGFAVVSMLPEPVGPQRPTSVAPPPVPSAVPREPAPAPPPEASPQRDRSSLPMNEATSPSAPLIMSSFALDLFALAAWGVGGNGSDSFGGGAGLHWFPRAFQLAPLSLRLGGGVRGGTIDALQSSTVTATAFVGIAWHPVRSASSHPFGVSLGADFVASYQWLQYQPPKTADAFGATPLTFAHWLPGMEGSVVVSYLLAPDVEGVLGLGLEYVFGLIYAEVHRGLHGAQTATFPQLRVVVPVGVRVRF